MRSTELQIPRFYFALPRLVVWLRGGNSDRTEKNWIEANIVGAAVMLVSYLALAQQIVRGAAGWKRAVLVLAVILVTWLFWLLMLYINAQLIKLLRAASVLRQLSNARAQSVLICGTTTMLSLSLLHRGPVLHAVATIWILAVLVNLVAAMLLVAFGSGKRNRL